MKIMKLRKNREFQNVYRNGTYLANKYLVVYKLNNAKGYNCFGITAGKKVGGSVVRNRVTRLIRQSIRNIHHLILPGYDIVVLARAGSGDASLRQMENALFHLIKKHNLLIQTGGNIND